MIMMPRRSYAGSWNCVVRLACFSIRRKLERWQNSRGIGRSTMNYEHSKHDCNPSWQSWDKSLRCSPTAIAHHNSQRRFVNWCVVPYRHSHKVKPQKRKTHYRTSPRRSPLPPASISSLKLQPMSHFRSAGKRSIYGMISLNTYVDVMPTPRSTMPLTA